jgi:hypothetical protein
VLGAHLADEPVATRGFAECEARAMNETDLWAALHRNMATLNEVAEAADDVPADTDVAWTRRTMKVPWFAEHMREELVLHGWDITGDDAAAQARMAQPWMTTHSVLAVGKPLLARAPSNCGPGSESRRDCGLPTPTTSWSMRTPTAPPSGWPTRTVRPPWKPTPQRVSCCCGAAGPPTHRGSAAVSVRKPWAEYAVCWPATDLSASTAGPPARCPA